MVVADDSAMMRAIVSNSLKAGGVEVVGTASDGDQALLLCERERPDAMTLDLAMPGLDGIGVLRALRTTHAGSGLPVVVVSAFSPAHGARAVDALAEGAFDLVAKPGLGEGLDAFRQSVTEKILQAIYAARRGDGAGPDVATRPPRPPATSAPPAPISPSTPSVARAQRVAPAPAPAPAAPAPGTPPARPAPWHRAPDGDGARPNKASRPARPSIQKVVLIATSTGGPRALAALLPKLPARLGMGTMIVQHMPPGFTGSLAARLDGTSALRVREAAGGELLDAGTALLAPGGRHLRLGSDGRTALSATAAIGGLRPRADLLIEDAAKAYGERLLLVVMTGMGNDGLRGAAEVRRRGGRILAEAQASCTVYGMPRAVVEGGLADEVLPLDQLAAAIAAEAR